MKRTLSMILAILLVTALASTSVFAHESDPITANDIAELACELFPEFEGQIKGESISNSLSSRSMNNCTLGPFIIEETRQTENGELLTYQQDERGVVVVTYAYGSEIVSSSYGTGYAYRKSNIYMYCNVSDEILEVNGFEYTLVQNAYDSISAYGTTSKSTATVRSVVGTTKETAMMKAFVRYYVSFTANKYGLSGELNAYLQAEVGTDTCDFTAYDG